MKNVILIMANNSNVSVDEDKYLKNLIGDYDIYRIDFNNVNEDNINELIDKINIYGRDVVLFKDIESYLSVFALILTTVAFDKGYYFGSMDDDTKTEYPDIYSVSYNGTFKLTKLF